MKIIKRLAIIGFFLLDSGLVLASGNNYDDVSINGRLWATFDDVYKSYPNRDDIYTKIYNEVERMDMKNHPANYVSNTREELDYRCNWLIKDGKVFLSNIESFAEYANLENIFGNQVKDGKVFANWLTDTLILGRGKVLAEGAKFIYENELKIVIKNGVLIDSISYKNYISRISKYQCDKDFINDRIDRTKLPKIRKKIVYAYIVVQPDKDGRFEHFNGKPILMIGSKNVTDTTNVFLKEAIRVTRSVPEWTVLYRENKIIPQGLMILFNNRSIHP